MEQCKCPFLCEKTVRSVASSPFFFSPSCLFDKKYSHNGCDCPKGWEGRHCEIPSEGSWTMSNIIEYATPSNVFSFVFLAVVVIGGGWVLSWWKDKRRREMNRRTLEEEEVYGDGFFAKDSARNFYSDNESEMSKLSSSSAKPREII